MSWLLFHWFSRFSGLAAMFTKIWNELGVKQILDVNFGCQTIRQGEEYVCKAVVDFISKADTLETAEITLEVLVKPKQ